MSLTPKQQLEQVNNPNLLSILSTVQGLPSQESLKHGAYVWKKLTAEGGDFVDFAVNNDPTAYPDGGTQDGYWYEKVVEGKAGVDFGEITLTTAQETVTVAHNLGVIPSFVALVSTHSASGLPGKSIYLVANNTVVYGAGGIVYGNFSPTKTDTQITFGSIYISGYGVNTTYPAWNYYWFAIA